MKIHWPVALAVATTVAVSADAGTAGKPDARPVLAVNLVVSPPVASVGQPLAVMLSVMNRGSVTVTEMTPALGLGGSAKAALLAMPDTLIHPPLRPGEEIVTAWGVVGISPGVLEFTATMQGVWVAGSRTVTGWASASATASVRTPPRLEPAWSGPPAGWCARRPCTVTLTVTNAGEAAAAGLAVPVLDIAGTCGATLVAGPAGATVTLEGGSAVTFTWTLAGTTGGTLTLTATVSGVDAGSGMRLQPAVACTELGLAAPGEIALSLSMPSEVSRGQWMAAVLTVTNTGGYAVTDLASSLAGPFGAGWIRRGSPPWRILPPGAARRFAWTWSVAGLGALPLRARVTCLTCDGMLAAAAEASATAFAVRPAELAAVLSVSATQVVSGGRMTLWLAVTNTGGAATGALTALVPTPSTSRSSLVAGPMRATLDRLPPGSGTVFAWTWSVAGQGSVGFTSRVAGRDANAGWGLSTGLLDAPGVRVLTPAALKIDRFALFPSPAVTLGVFVTASLVVTNKGETPARLTGLAVKEKKSNGSVLGPGSIFSPMIPADIPAGDSMSVVWTYRTGAWGTASVSANATVVEPATGRKLPTLQAVSNRITVTVWTQPGGLE